MQRDRILITEMIDAATRILAITAGASIDEIASDANTRDALLWNFTVLGEAANQVKQETRQLHESVGWSDPIRLRNRIMHAYSSIDLNVLIVAAEIDVPILLAKLVTIENTL